MYVGTCCDGKVTKRNLPIMDISHMDLSPIKEARSPCHFAVSTATIYFVYFLSF